MLATNEVLQQKRYRIIQQTEEDSTGAVYEAFDNVLETNVTLKEIKINLERVTTAAQQETRKLAFASEAKILTEITHEALLQVRDYFSEIDRQYLVIESVGERDLRDLVERGENPVGLTDLANWADQLLDALHCLHTRVPPIVHGDIKPQNVKLTANGKVKLLALSLPKTPDSKTNAFAQSQASLTAGGLHYLPLEQIWEGLDAASKKVILNSYDEKSEKILEQPADARSDIYAIGATLYHLATAQFPTDALERSIDILEGKPDPLPAPAALNAKIPIEVSNVLMRALEIKRENRFSTAAIMRQILRAAVGQAKGRAAAEAKKQKPETAEINLEKQNPPEPQQPNATEQKSAEQQLAARKELEVEAEQKRQLELIEQQLRESEVQRLKAEERAAFAEKRLSEKDVFVTEAVEVINLDDNDILELENSEVAPLEILEPVIEPLLLPMPAAPVNRESPVVVALPLPAEDITPVADKPPVVIAAARETAPDEFNELFAEPAKDNKIFKRMAAVAVILLIFSGAGWGVWSSFVSKPPAAAVAPSQPISASEPAKPAPTVEEMPAPTVQINSETGIDSALPPEAEAVQNTGDAPEQKYKSPQFSSKAKKQTLPSAKTPAAQKKAVTVEDLINDN